MDTDSTTLNASASPSPAVILEMATAYWRSQAVYVAAKLGLADLLKQGPMTCAALAQATHTHPASLCRLCELW
jgi:Dimerisation domain